MSLHAKLYRFAENTREERTREKVYTMIVINYKLTSLISVDSFLIKINDLTLSNKVQSFTYQLALLCPEITAWGFFDIGIQLIPGCRRMQLFRFILFLLIQSVQYKGEKKNMPA